MGTLLSEKHELSHILFSDPECNVFAVLDGASIPNLLNRLGQDAPQHVCLYRGELESDLKAAAPYLVQMSPSSEFTHWLLLEGWGNHWGIFATSPAGLHTLRKHFRTFLLVKGPDSKTFYFRYYDPRVLRLYLPSCNEAETKAVFGPVCRYVAEDRDPSKALLFSQDTAGVEVNTLILHSP